VSCDIIFPGVGGGGCIHVTRFRSQCRSENGPGGRENCCRVNDPDVCRHSRREIALIKEGDLIFDRLGAGRGKRPE